MPFGKFRVLEKKWNLTHDGVPCYFCDDEDDYIAIPDDGTHIIQYQTPFTDKEGNEIWQGDTLHCDHHGQDSATMKAEGYDYLVEFDNNAGQWYCYENIGGRIMKHTALFKIAKKGRIKTS